MRKAESIAEHGTTLLLKPLKDYISRRLRTAYLAGEIKTDLYTADDVLDETMLRAYHQYDRKLAAATLHEWLVTIADEVLNQYVQETKIDAARKVRLEEIESRSER